MRHAAALLLLLILPGLLLPAGLWLHVCRCDARAAEGRPSCCQALGDAEPAPASACCRRDPAPLPPSDGCPRAVDDNCGCVWLALPETRQEPAPLDLGWLCLQAPMHARLPSALLLWRDPAPLRVWTAANSRPPPPPDQERNLQLRL